MKTIHIITSLAFIGINADAQGTWTQKANLTGAARQGAVGFSIGTKGYIGTGHDGTAYKKDFWAYTQGAGAMGGTWTQMADFDGTARSYAVGFSIGNKGYIGPGFDNVAPFGNGTQDFWEWDGDPASTNYNTWVQKSDFGGGPRYYAVGFSIGSKGYIGTGMGTNITERRDFWEYDPADVSNGNDVNGNPKGKWFQKSDLNGIARTKAVSFSIGNKGYIGSGTGGTFSSIPDFWEWDQATDTWTQKANFGGKVSAVGFSIGAKGYIGNGKDGLSSSQKDFWEYTPGAGVMGGTWTQMANFGGTARYFAVGFSIGNNGYIGTGNDGAVQSDFWEYSPSVTSVSELNSENTVAIYPNPFSIQTTISLSKEINDASLIIYDLSGKEVKNINFSGKQVVIERENLPSGMYFYQIVSERKNISNAKLIIQ